MTDRDTDQGPDEPEATGDQGVDPASPARAVIDEESEDLPEPSEPA